MEHFAKRMSAGAPNFLRAGRFVKLGHFDKHFAKKIEEKRAQLGNKSGDFSP